MLEKKKRKKTGGRPKTVAYPVVLSAIIDERVKNLLALVAKDAGISTGQQVRNILNRFYLDEKDGYNKL